MQIQGNEYEIRHFHFCCGLGGGAKGMNEARPTVGRLQGRFRCLGGIDIDAGALKDFERLAGAKGTLMDLFSRDQYEDFHGRTPPADWAEATPFDIQRAAGGERPHIVFISAPCKGLSGLLSETLSKTTKYQALNRLTLRCVWLMAEAWSDDPPELIIFENVPRIASRGRALLDQIVSLLRTYGYAVAETAHDCGEIGGLAQSRKRFLLVARHQVKVPPFLYEPTRKRLRGVGEVLSQMPAPGDPEAGPMHRVPSLHWKTWVRLAFVEAGKDWRSLNRLAVEDGFLKNFAIERVEGERFMVASPGFSGANYSQFGVIDWQETAGVVTGQRSPGQGRFSVADPRPMEHTRWKGGKYRVTRFDEPAGAVIAASTTGNGAFAVADPRPGFRRKAGDSYLTAGHYGVIDWTAPTGAVSSSAGHDNGKWSVADPRLPAASDRLVTCIEAEDGTWHRPFTTLELAALQSLIDPEEVITLSGGSDSDWRERIGNAVPAQAAKAIAEVMGETLLLAWSGETFVLGSTPIWVRPVALALSVDQSGVPA